jgi:hypothetical protein
MVGDFLSQDYSGKLLGQLAREVEADTGIAYLCSSSPDSHGHVPTHPHTPLPGKVKTAKPPNQLKTMSCLLKNASLSVIQNYAVMSVILKKFQAICHSSDSSVLLSV